MTASTRRPLPAQPGRRGWCPGLARPMPTGDGLLARIHPPLGVITLGQARAVAEGARRFGNGHVDLTARANLQVRGVGGATRAPLARLLEAAGLGDVRADGGPQRLTLTSPLAGLEPTEAIDVPRLARAIEAAGRAIPHLPAKTLVAIEGRVDGAMPEADLFVSALAPGHVAVALASDDGPVGLAACREDDAPAVVARLLDAFARSGRRRMRDLSRDDRAGLSRGLEGAHRIEGPGPAAAARDGLPPTGLSALRPGLSVLAVDAPFGRCTAHALEGLIDTAAALGAEELRLSPRRGFVLLVREDGRAARALAGLSERFITRPDDPRRHVVACTGAPACASGSTPTLADAARIAGSLAPGAMRGLAIHVSGCAKGCARPGPADLTLVGRDGAYDAVVAGGADGPPAVRLPIEAALERLGRAATVGLAAAFAPDPAAAWG